MQKTIIAPPIAEKIRKELEIHGHTRIDNYYWLNDRENPKVIDYLNAENDYKKSMLAHTKPLQKTLFEEMVGRIKQTDMTVPYFLNGYHYYVRYEQEKEYPIYCRKEGSLDASEQIMLNVNDLAEGHNYFNVTGLSVSPDNRYLAFGVDKVSRRIYTIHFKDLMTGEVLTETIANTTGSAVWANDNKTIFYTVKDESLRAYKVFKHQFGVTTLEDEEVYHETDETFVTFAYKTKSKQFILIGSHSTLSTEYRYLDANKPDGNFQLIQARERDHEYQVYHYKDKFYFKTNWNAKNFRLMETSILQTTKENWKEVIPHREDTMLEDVGFFDNYLVLDERRRAVNYLRVINWSDKSEYYIDFGEDVYSVYLGTNPDFHTDVLRYGYTSLTTPNSVVDINMKTQEKTLQKQQEVLGGFDANNYQSERLFANALDGTEIPISVVYRKGLVKNGDNPLLLYGYGSYGVNIDPYFSAARLSLIDRGFVYVIAHIRGGEEMGRYWYEDGKLLKKKNTFSDFITCAEYLIDLQFTNSSKMFAMGGSAGGLLMGTVLNMRSDLFKGVIAAVPFVDVVTTMLDESIPLTTGEFDEWGNPKNKEYYEYMLSYSPYDNIEAKDYPALLITTGLHDSQVQYWEPAKWVAKLRELKTDDNPVLLHTNMETGHGGASGRFKRFKEVAMEYAFLLDLL
ncbi:MAG: S9 family peptidase [Chitinophagales bacterium]